MIQLHLRRRVYTYQWEWDLYMVNHKLWQMVKAYDHVNIPYKIQTIQTSLCEHTSIYDALM